ncbi:hypothetical protein FTX61_05045 [Nitriliruptoraceae bacterium ZYF776]|nr:hypothetical protein [Profundirhabdus halotolerans]
MRTRRRATSVAAVLAVSLCLAACGDGEPDTDEAGTTTAPDEDPVTPEPGDDGEVVDGDADDDGAADAPAEDAGDADAGETDGAGDGDGGDQPGAGDDVASDAPPLPGDESTAEVEVEGDGTLLTVTDVRIGRHDGFDRVVFELGGADGRPGYFIHYVDEPQQQGSGNTVEVAGTSYLEVLVRGVALPFDRPEEIDAWEQGRLAGPEGGLVAEVVDENIFEGQQQFFIGLDGGPFGYRVDRLSDPERIVIDLVPRL